VERRSNFLVFVLALVFFVISLLTNIIGPLIPDIIRSFDISLTTAAFLPFSFFVAYGVMSIPTGVIIEKSGEKLILLGGFGLGLGGSLLFALHPLYPTAILSLFMIGLGMAALQVAINPLLRVVGGEENYAFNAVLVQAVFGAASFLSPLIYSHFAEGLDPSRSVDRLLLPLIPAGLPWIAMYWVFSAVTIVMIAFLAALRFPHVDRKDDERVGALETHLELLRRPIVWLYFIGVFAYVGIEQGLGDWMSQFLSTVHHYKPGSDGAEAVSGFWGLMTVGAVLGLVLLKFIDSRKVLILFSAATVVVFSVALFGNGPTSRAVFPWTGFTISVMWSIVFSLALNSLDEHHGTFSGILCTGVVGGAVVPLFIGFLGDRLGLRGGLCFLYLPIAYILAMGFWARPLVTNKTVGGG
jgi:fucose permease